MKAFCLMIVLTGAALIIGCGATPAYSAHERSQMISRNWGIERRQISDDVDAFWLLRPASHLTLWHVR